MSDDSDDSLDKKQTDKILQGAGKVVERGDFNEGKEKKCLFHSKKIMQQKLGNKI